MRYLLLAYFILFFSGCVGDEERMEEVVKAQHEVERPQNNFTGFHNGLKTFGKDANRFYQGYGFEPGSIMIGVRSIDNATSNAKLLKISSVIATALQTMFFSTYNSVFKITDIEYKNDLSSVSLMGDFRLKFNGVAIDGAITEANTAGSLSNSGSFDISFGGGDTETDTALDMSNDIKATTISLDLRMVDISSKHFNEMKTYITNSLTVYGKSESGGLGFYIMGTGLSLSSSVQKNQSLDFALRVLAEYSVLELMGRYLELPYWHCLGSDKPDEELMALKRNIWTSSTEADRIVRLKAMLVYYGFPLKLTPEYDAQTQLAVKTVRNVYGLRGKSRSARFMENLFMAMPICENNLARQNRLLQEITQQSTGGHYVYDANGKSRPKTRFSIVEKDINISTGFEKENERIPVQLFFNVNPGNTILVK